MGYRLSRAAERDIVHIFVEGMREFGIAQADTYHAELQRTFRLIAANPRMARQRTEIAPPVRIHPCGSHVIVYVVEEGDDVLIVRVRHGREDWADNPR